MDDLISRAAAIDYLITNMGWRDVDGYEVDDADEKRAIITNLVNGIPAVDAAPVVHARWSKARFEKPYAGYTKATIYYVCSACGKDVDDALFNYCPKCGAKMDGDA